MKIFVTGGAGFIGSNFIRYALGSENNHAIVNYDKLTYAANLANLHSVADQPGHQFVKGGTCNALPAEAAMRGCDAVVHFAAESHVDRSIYEPSTVIQTNVTGTFTLLEVARKLGVPRFAHIFDRRSLWRRLSWRLLYRKDSEGADVPTIIDISAIPMRREPVPTKRRTVDRSSSG